MQYSITSVATSLVLLIGFTNAAFVAVVPNQGNNILRLSSQAQQQQRVTHLKTKLLNLGTSTNRGFTASSLDQRNANQIIKELKKYNPTTEPASPYYTTTTTGTKATKTSTISGKWTLVYTDAPDITSLGGSLTSKVGRIGQDCTTPPFIANVIEWIRPDWASSFPFSGSNNSRILQQVVTKATSTPEQPLQLTLSLVGVKLYVDSTNGTLLPNSEFWNAFQDNGIVMEWFQRYPVDLKGPMQTYFGKCSILYLDEELRIIQTGQNYVAVNVRQQNQDESWFS